MSKYLKLLPVLLIGIWVGGLLASCSISYSFTGSNIDYSKTSSISIKDFPNMAPLVYAPLSQEFTEALRDKYTRQTKLQVIRDGGDLELEGEITGYNFTSLAAKDGQYGSQTRLTVTVRIRYTNKTNPDDELNNQTYSAYYEFSSESTIDQMQDQACESIIDEIIDQIYNDTVAKW